MTKVNRYVVRHSKAWAVKRAGVEKPEGTFDTQKKAEDFAKDTVRDLGGGEVVIQGREGKWRDSDTVAPGNDPCPPHDKK